MKTIWKFPLEITDSQAIEMPFNSEILTVQVQGDMVCIWALVNPDAEKEYRTFEVFGTGYPVKHAERKYIGTFQVQHGSLVFHVFEPF